ncbi:MAG: YbaK/EbsC family protein [Desulfovibrionaceae bacterium]|nr:YbaK/EbsC family protein [Desulfovibrionaceae bacterium]
MSVLEVKAYLDKWNRGKDVVELEASSATVELAALALGVLPAKIAKTIAFSGPPLSASRQDAVAATENKPLCVLIVASGDSRIDSSKFKKLFGFKARMLPPAETLSITGHAVGGVCPFALKSERIAVYLDVSLQRFDSVFPACGSSNSLIELTPNELFICAQAKKWIDVCKED